MKNEMKNAIGNSCNRIEQMEDRTSKQNTGILKQPTQNRRKKNKKEQKILLIYKLHLKNNIRIIRIPEVEEKDKRGGNFFKK